MYMIARSSRSQRGLTLIEVLVTLVILAVGLLGIAGLHLIGMRSSHDGYLRTRAVMVATEAVDRLRANRMGVSQSCYEDTGVIFFAVGEDPADVPVATSTCLGGTATSVSDGVQADFDALDRLFNDRDGLAGFIPALPGGRLEIDCPSVGTDCTATVSWNEGARSTFLGVAGTSVVLEFRL